MNESHRYMALDVLRGITIALMILVNTPGSWQHVYSPLRHAQWHGCTPADLVFPFFLFAVGVSLYFSLSGYQNPTGKEVIRRVGRRVLLIFALGLFINSYPQWLTDYSHLRIMGVLQRIAVAYGLAALIVLVSRQRWLPGICAFVLIAYWGILFFWGGADPYSLSGNANIPFDQAILGNNHLYRGFGIAFDPEGLLSSLPATVTVLIGYLTGMMIGKYRADRLVIRLVCCGVIFTITGYLWELLFPINKPLWTSSYVLYTAGLAALLFALLVYILDVKERKRWILPFTVFGANPLFLFIFSIVWAKTLHLLIRIPDGEGNTLPGNVWLYQNIFEPIAGTMNGSLLYALAHILFFWLIGYLLYRYRIFIRVQEDSTLSPKLSG